jgi:hypothetical protein
MWPPSIPLRGFYGPPPFAPELHARNEAMRLARLRHLRYMQMQAMRPQGPHPMAFPPPGGLRYPPPAGIPPPPPGSRLPKVTIIPARGSDNGYDISEIEDEQLMFVDFVEELEKTKTATVADLLRRFTTLKDVTDDDSLGDFLNADSDYDSDDSMSTSSSSDVTVDN